MSAIEPYYHLLGVSLENLNESETLFFEIDLFCTVYGEIKKYFREKYYEDFFRLIKFTKEGEDLMLERDFLKTVINDILATNEYNLAGIAYYTDTPEEVVVDVLTGQNQRPSAVFMQRVLDLHRLVKRDMYRELTRKIFLSYKNSI